MPNGLIKKDKVGNYLVKYNSKLLKMLEYTTELEPKFGVPEYFYIKNNNLILYPTPQEKVYMPGHPDADEDGFVKMSNVDPLVDIADAKMAQRAYEASITVMSMAKTMAQRALEIGG